MSPPPPPDSLSIPRPSQQTLPLSPLPLQDHATWLANSAVDDGNLWSAAQKPLGWIVQHVCSPALLKPMHVPMFTLPDSPPPQSCSRPLHPLPTPILTHKPRRKNRWRSIDWFDHRDHKHLLLIHEHEGLVVYRFLPVYLALLWWTSPSLLQI